MELPPLTKVPTLVVDMTPDADFALRILRTYLQQCECDFDLSDLPPKRRTVFEMMNQQNAERRMLLEAAIKKLGG